MLSVVTAHGAGWYSDMCISVPVSPSIRGLVDELGLVACTTRVAPQLASSSMILKPRSKSSGLGLQTHSQIVSGTNSLLSDCPMNWDTVPVTDFDRSSATQEPVSDLCGTFVTTTWSLLTLGLCNYCVEESATPRVSFLICICCSCVVYKEFQSSE